MSTEPKLVSEISEYPIEMTAAWAGAVALGSKRLAKLNRPNGSVIDPPQTESAEGDKFDNA